jgi:hypothetical protein
MLGRKDTAMQIAAITPGIQPFCILFADMDRIKLISSKQICGFEAIHLHCFWFPVRLCFSDEEFQKYPQVKQLLLMMTKT